MAEVFRMTAVFDHAPRRFINRLAQGSGAYGSDRRCLRVQYKLVYLPLFCRRPADADGPRHIAEISVRFRAEVERNQVAFFDAPVRRRGMRHGAVPARRHDRIKGRLSGPFFPHQVFELKSQFLFRGPGSDILPQFTERLFRPTDGFSDTRDLSRILPLSEPSGHIAASFEPETGLLQFPEHVNQNRGLIEPNRAHAGTLSGIMDRSDPIFFLYQYRYSLRLPP